MDLPGEKGDALKRKYPRWYIHKDDYDALCAAVAPRSLPKHLISIRGATREAGTHRGRVLAIISHAKRYLGRDLPVEEPTVQVGKGRPRQIAAVNRKEWRLLHRRVMKNANSPGKDMTPDGRYSEEGIRRLLKVPHSFPKLGTVTFPKLGIEPTDSRFVFTGAGRRRQAKAKGPAVQLRWLPVYDPETVKARLRTLGLHFGSTKAPAQKRDPKTGRTPAPQPSGVAPSSTASAPPADAADPVLTIGTTTRDAGTLRLEEIWNRYPLLTKHQREAVRKKLDRWKANHEDECETYDEGGKTRWRYPTTKVAEVVAEVTQTPRQRTCARCGKGYSSPDHRSKYCSSTCRSAASRGRSR
jgi:hypothetical protein